MAESFLEPGRYPHGTRARYVADRCRCKRCKGANTAYYRERHRRALAAAAEVTPSRRRGAQWTAFMRTRPDGTAYSVTAPMCRPRSRCSNADGDDPMPADLTLPQMKALHAAAALVRDMGTMGPGDTFDPLARMRLEAGPGWKGCLRRAIAEVSRELATSMCPKGGKRA